MSTRDVPYARAFAAAAPRLGTTPLSELIEHRVVAPVPSWLGGGAPQHIESPRGSLKAVPTPVPEPAPDPEPEPLAPPPPEADPEVTRAMADAIHRLDELQQRLAADPDVVELALVVAEKILQQELQIRPEHVLEAVQLALRELRGDMPTRIRVHPNMLDRLQEARPDLEGNGVEMVADPTLGLGGCIIESRHRALDASLEERLERFRSAIHDAMSVDGGGRGGA